MANAPDILNNRNVQVFLYHLDPANIIQRAQGHGGATALADTFQDPMKFEDTTDALFWVNKPYPPGPLVFKNRAYFMKQMITESIQDDLHSLSSQDFYNQSSKPLPLNQYDITNLVISIKGFVLELAMNNTVNVDLNLDADPLGETILQVARENDLLEIRMQLEDDTDPYAPGKTKTVFIGFVTNITKEVKEASINRMGFSAFGIQKMLSLTRIVEVPSLGENSIIRGLEINDQKFTGFATVFKGLSTVEICNKLFHEVLAYTASGLPPFHLYNAAVDVIERIQDAKKILNDPTSMAGKAWRVSRGGLDSIDATLVSNLDKASRAAANYSLSMDNAKKAPTGADNSGEYADNIAKTLEVLDRLATYLDTQGVSYGIYSLYDSGTLLTKLDEFSASMTTQAAAQKSLIPTFAQTIDFVFDRTQLGSVLDYKVAFLTLYAFFKLRYLLAHTAFVDNDVTDFTMTAQVEEGVTNKVFNEMTMRGYQKFFPVLRSPTYILDQMRSTTYFDVFSNRLGTIFVRPPRYNWIKMDGDEQYKTGGDKHITQIDSHVIESGDIRNFKFTSQDVSLMTHVDTKWILTFQAQPAEFPTGSFTDFNILFQYGLRMESPIDNPNVRNARIGALWSAVSLALTNANTRTISLDAYGKEYHIGEMYVIRTGRALDAQKPFSPQDPATIENEQVYVGYLAKDEILIEYGKATRHALWFTFVREFNYELITSNPMANDIASIYDRGIGLSARLDLMDSATSAPIWKANQDAMNKLILDPFFKIGVPGQRGMGVGAKVRAMRILPTIWDLIHMLETDPGLGEDDQSVIKGSQDQEPKADAAARAETQDGKYFIKQLEPDPRNPPDKSEIMVKEWFADKYQNYVEPMDVAGYCDGASTPTAETDTATGDMVPKKYKSPFSIGSFSKHSAIMGNRMIRALYHMDMELKKSFPIFHKIEEKTHYGTTAPQYQARARFDWTKDYIDGSVRNTANIQYPTILNLNATPVDVGTGEIPVLPNIDNSIPDNDVRRNVPTRFHNDYFAAGSAAAGNMAHMPAGTIVAVADTGEAYPFSVKDSQKCYIHYGKSGGGYVTSINIEGLTVPLDMPKKWRFFFVSPYFEWNIERFQSLEWISRGIEPPAKFAATTSEKSPSSTEAHLNGRAVDFVLDSNNPNLPMVPGVYDGSTRRYTVADAVFNRFSSALQDGAGPRTINGAVKPQGNPVNELYFAGIAPAYSPDLSTLAVSRLKPNSIIYVHCAVEETESKDPKTHAVLASDKFFGLTDQVHMIKKK